VKQEEYRNTSKKQPTYAVTRNTVSQQRYGLAELTKRWARNVKQQTSKPPRSAPMLARAEIFPSPFGDMHGQ